ncbi:MAG: Gfo/Idh/MocA family oxidoreductase [Planctomycetaceae bacterium]|nr:Gfo/Idh/MocA family oxidoreductase [Planctomycetaceae bacterium]
MNLSRRNFLRASALSTISAAAALKTGSVAIPAFCQTANANEKLNLAFIGVWGQARETMSQMKAENFYAFCDVDERRLGMASKVYPGTKNYLDYRKMLEELDDKIDAVVVSTPDHSHAPASVMAMKMKKHCYCEKPLAHEVYEARRMANVAAEMKVATQMGTQPNSWPNYYETEEIVKSGAIGKIKEVHVWTCTGNTTGYVKGVGGNVDVGMALGNGWGQPSSQEKPGEQPIPQGLDWDLWVGPAKFMPYNECFVPANWRRWWNFGSGQLGDFGCHYMNLPIRTLQLLNAKTISAQGPAVNPYACPEWLRVQYTSTPRTSSPLRELLLTGTTARRFRRLRSCSPITKSRSAAMEFFSLVRKAIFTRTTQSTRSIPKRNTPISKCLIPSFRVRLGTTKNSPKPANRTIRNWPAAPSLMPGV